MSLKHGILGLLNYGPMTGYELNKAFKDSLSFFWQAQTSQIYRELNNMERLGWLSSEQVIQTDKPNKRVYSLTEEGESELKNWLTDPEADVKNAMSVRSAFLMRVFFGGEMGNANAHKMLRAIRDECIAAITALGRVDGSISDYGEVVSDINKTKYWKLTALFGQSYYQAMLGWAEKAIAVSEEKE